ncbi:MAG: DPP IV N-terminal domain-containing protein [Spirochaetes bacterium]|nr:DPP IV N-terminal domain-containing protein [Spirochaetota bacterium]
MENISKKQLQIASGLSLLSAGVKFLIFFLPYFTGTKEGGNDKEIIVLLTYIELALFISIFWSLKKFLKSTLQFEKVDIHILVLLIINTIVTLINNLAPVKTLLVNQLDIITFLGTLIFGIFLVLFSVKLQGIHKKRLKLLNPFTILTLITGFFYITTVFNKAALLIEIPAYIVLGVMFKKAFQEASSAVDEAKDYKIPSSVKVLAVIIIVIGLIGACIKKGVELFINRVESMTVWVEDLRTGQGIKLEKGARPRFSVDGKQVIFHRFDKTGGGQRGVIFLYSLLNKKTITLIDDKHSNIMPSMGGRYVLYTSVRKKKNGATQRDLWLYNTDMKKRRQLTNDPPDESTALISPDGQWVMFLQKEGLKYQDIYLISTGGGKKRRLTHTASLLDTIKTPSWSSDSSLIAYISLNSIKIINRNGKLIDDIFLEGLSSPRDVFFFPGQKNILVISATDSSKPSFKGNLYLLSRKDLKYSLLKKGRGFFEFEYDISPDGRLITYTK